MKIKKIFLFLIFIFILSGCSNLSKYITENTANTITKPNQKLEIAGIWKNTDIYSVNADNNLERIKNDDSDHIFLSKTAFDFKENYVLNPNISSRFIAFKSYVLTRFTSIPDDIKPESEEVPVVKFTNKTSFNQEFIIIGNNKLITIYLGKIYVYEKITTIDKSVEEKKFLQIQSLIRGGGETLKSNFGLSIAFRKRDTSSNQINYNYYTYYIKQTENDDSPNIYKVSDVIIPKFSGLWSIVSSKREHKNDRFDTYTLSANPTFLNSNNESVNKIEDTIFRRIDYVNSDYIAVTNFSYLSNEVKESYNIFSMENLSKKEPLSVMNIAGAAGNETLLTTYKEVANSLLNRGLINIIDSTPNPTNIGIKRVENLWKFYSNIEQTEVDDKKTKVYKTFDLRITPIINIASSNSNSPFSWTEVKRRRPEAIDATVSPDNKYILIQLKNSLEFYPIYFNYIGNKPLFTIQNVEDYEMVMNQWVTNENINSIYNEYSKLKNLNSYIIYH